MNEKKKLAIIISLVALVIIIIPVMVIIKSIQSKEIYKNFEEAMASKTNQVIYIGRPNCSYCQQFRPKLDEYAEKYDFEYVYINVNEVDSFTYNKLLTTLNIESGKFGTPYTIVTKDNKILATQDGDVLQDKELFDFLQEGGIISKDEKYDGEEEKTSLTYIDTSKFLNLVAGQEKAVIVIGQTTCGFCAQARPILSEIVDEEKIVINYIDFNTLSSEQQDSIINSFDYLKNTNWGTPIMLVVQNNKLLNQYEGARSKTEYIKVLKENGVIK